MRAEKKTLILTIFKLDKLRRELTFDADKKKAEQNAVSKKIPAMKKAGEDTTAIFEEMKSLSDAIKADDRKDS